MWHSIVGQNRGLHRVLGRTVVLDAGHAIPIATFPLLRLLRHHHRFLVLCLLSIIILLPLRTVTVPLTLVQSTHLVIVAIADATVQILIVQLRRPQPCRCVRRLMEQAVLVVVVSVDDRVNDGLCIALVHRVPQVT